MDTTQTSVAARDGRRLTLVARGSGPRLVCHPGGAGFPGTYFEELGGVADERTAVGLNPAGAGDSDQWPEELYSLDRCADDVDDVRSALGEERLDLLGHSAGGFVAIRYARRFPERVRRLVLVGTFPQFDAIRAARERFFSRKEGAPEFREAVTAARERMSGVELTVERRKQVVMASFSLYFESLSADVRAFADRIAAGKPPDLRAFDSFNAQVASFDLRPDLPHIGVPALVVYGAGELERAGADEPVAGLPNARLAIIDGAGHFPWVEQPERFRGALLEFLSE